MKVKDDAAVAELPLGDITPAELREAGVSEPKRHNRHVQIALDHLGKRRVVLLAKRAQLTKEIEEIDSAILALE